MNTETGCVRRTDAIFVVTGVDKTLTSTAAFEGWVTHPDTQPEDINVGHVLARIRRHDRRWQAGRTCVDGVHWEERTWAQEDFIAFRDHVAALVEVRRRRPHRAAERLATCWIDIRTCRRRQEGEDPASERYASLEREIADHLALVASLGEELEAPSSPRERLAEMLANCGISIRNCRRMQEGRDPASEDHDHLEGLIAEIRKRAEIIREELEARQASPPDMVTAAR